MAKIKFSAGDFGITSGEYTFATNKFKIVEAVKEGSGYTYNVVEISGDDVETIMVASEENVKKLKGTVGWGAVGWLTLGPVGLLAGLLLGGKKKETSFIIGFKDGRKALGTMQTKEYAKMAFMLGCGE